jgi:thioredoxin-dependent peroxiredoxin
MRMTVMALAAALISTPSFAALNQGAMAPSFETLAAVGGKSFTFKLDAARKKGAVVLYFFPAAFTPGCTMEAHEFAEAAGQFKKLGASLLGAAGGDDIEKLTRFTKEECRDKFPVGMATPEMISGYDVALSMPGRAMPPGRTSRTSYVIAPSGQIIYAYSNMDYRGHVTGVLGALKAWKAGQKK